MKAHEVYRGLKLKNLDLVPDKIIGEDTSTAFGFDSRYVDKDEKAPRKAYPSIVFK